MKLKHILKEYDATDTALPMHKVINNMSTAHRTALGKLQTKCRIEIEQEAKEAGVDVDEKAIERLNYLTYNFFMYAYMMGEKSIEYRKVAKIPDKPRDVKSYKEVVDYIGKLPSALFNKEYIKTSKIGALTDPRDKLARILRPTSEFGYDAKLVAFLKDYFEDETYKKPDGRGVRSPSKEAEEAIKASGIPSKYIVYNKGGVVIIAAATRRVAMAIGSDRYFNKKHSRFCISRDDCENLYDDYTLNYDTNSTRAIPYFMFNFNVPNVDMENKSYQGSVFIVEYVMESNGDSYLQYAVTRGDNAPDAEFTDLTYRELVNIYATEWGYHDPALDFIKTINVNTIRNKTLDVERDPDSLSVRDRKVATLFKPLRDVYPNLTKIKGKKLFTANVVRLNDDVIKVPAYDWRSYLIRRKLFNWVPAHDLSESITLDDLTSYKLLIPSLHLDGISARSPASVGVSTNVDIVLGRIEVAKCEFSSLEGMPYFLPSSNDKSRSYIGIEECNSLTSLEGLETVKNLTYISIRRCESIKSLKGCPSVNEITLYECNSIQDLTSIPSHVKPSSIIVNRCNRFESLKGCPDVHTVKILACNNIKEWGVTSNIQVLTISNMEVNNIPNIENLPTTVKTIRLDNCKGSGEFNMNKIESFGDFLYSLMKLKRKRGFELEVNGMKF